jgi:mono/diheme cytochrome c family protein
MWRTFLIKFVLIVALTGGVALSASGCESGGSYGDTPTSLCFPAGACPESLLLGGITAAQGNAAQGASVFQAQCSECHGSAGVGVKDAYKVDMTSPAWQAMMRDGEIVRATRVGRPPVMPSFKLSDDVLRDLLAHIRTLQVAPAPSKTGGGY